jgi:hypothetical protein
MSATEAQIIAGTLAKKEGHLQEQRICSWLASNYPGTFIVHGGNKTKIDILDSNSTNTYSVKSVSSNHTQCHLTSTLRWCEYFHIQQPLRNWFDLFFGVPHEDISCGTNRRHRLTTNEIPTNLSNQALDWFNDNRMSIFEVILEKGMQNTPVTHLVWHSKKTKQTSLHTIESIKSLVHSGKWILNPTTLHFETFNSDKLFHLQMKGSGKKYTSGYHSMMFHVYKCF